MLERNVRVTFCSDVRIMTDGASHSRNKKTASHRSTNSVVTSPPCRPHPPSPLGATLPLVVVVAVAEVVEEEAEVAEEEEVGEAEVEASGPIPGRPTTIGDDSDNGFKRRLGRV